MTKKEDTMVVCKHFFDKDTTKNYTATENEIICIECLDFFMDKDNFNGKNDRYQGLDKDNDRLRLLCRECAMKRKEELIDRKKVMVCEHFLKMDETKEYLQQDNYNTIACLECSENENIKLKPLYFDYAMEILHKM
jgi:hypothetical protein